MFPDRAASAELADAPSSWVDDAAGLHISSYALARPASRRAVVDLAHRAGRDGAHLSLDTASVHLLTEIGVQSFCELVEAIAADVVIANAPEAALLLRTGARRPATTYVVKDGPRPVTITPVDGERFCVPVPQVTGVTDTTGAGDAFAAGFLHSVLNGAPTRESVAAGIALASQVLKTPGATVAAPTLGGTP